MKATLLIAALFLVTVTGTHAQQSATEKKLTKLLQPKGPGSKVKIDTKSKLLNIDVPANGTVLNFKVPWTLVDNTPEFRSPQLTDTAYTVNIMCRSGHSCIDILVNNQPKRTKAIKFSFATEKDSKEFSRCLNQLSKPKTAASQKPH